jgi:hypothetical protein
MIEIAASRFLTLRPSHPKVQKRRDADVARAKARRTERRLMAAMAEADTNAALNAGEGVDVAGFAKWFATFKDAGHLDVLTEHEVETFRQAARAYHHKALSPTAWMEVLRAIRDKHMGAGVAAQIAAYHRPRRYEGGPQGW